MSILRHTVFLLLVLFIAKGGSVSADTANVSNSISINASSGGNVVGAGEMFIGTTTTSVDITTEINGEVVEDVHKKFEGGAVSVESNTEVVNDTVESNVDITTSNDAVPAQAEKQEQKQEQAEGYETTAVERVVATSSLEQSTEVGEEKDEQTTSRETGGFVAKVRTFVANIFSYVTGWFS